MPPPDLAAPPVDTPATLAADRQLEISGHSMRFLLRNGDRIRVRRVPPADLRLGDIVVFMKDREVVAHRLVWTTTQTSGILLRTKGDGQTSWDPPVPASGIVGRVEAYQRGTLPWVLLRQGPRRYWNHTIALFSTALFIIPGCPWLVDQLIKRLSPLYDAAHTLYRKTRDLTLRALAYIRDRFFQVCAWLRDRIIEAARWLRDRFLQACAWLRDRVIEAALWLRDRFLQACAWTRDRIVETSLWLRDRFLQTYAWTRDRVCDAALWLRDRFLKASAWLRDRIVELWPPIRDAAVRQARRLLAALYQASLPLLHRRGLPLRDAIRRLWLDLGGDPVPSQPASGLLWEGEVELSQTVVVPAGSRLCIRPGTRIHVSAAPGPVLDRLAFQRRMTVPPSGLCALVVHGTLEILGEPGREVVFSGAAWGGILLLGQARADIRHARFDAAADYSILGADFCRAELHACEFRGGLGGTAWAGASAARLSDCRFSEAGKAAVWLQDDAKARLRGCRFFKSRCAVLVEGCAMAADLKGNYRDCSDSAAAALGHSALLARASVWEQNAGLFASGAARLRLRDCRFARNAVGLQTLQRAQARLAGVCGEGNGIGIWVQNDSSLQARGGTWQDNREALHCSHQSSARLRGVSFMRQSKTAILAEEDSRVELRDCVFSDNENAILALQRPRLAASGCRFSRCRDTAVWLDHRCDARLSDNAFESNGKDSHCERNPTYDAPGARA
ncbi:MAG: right-handed parallel beta-helix repeat-containing protein [Elusimicrobia bacterium]|nr:right-handed parallel beta-helix repeat-containing protein [Elusimicrobiota bacterium]